MHKRLGYTSLISSLALVAIIASLTACKQNEGTPEASQPAPQQAPVMPAGPGPSTMPASSPTQAGGVAWTVPTGWGPGPEHQMRIATYRTHAIAGDPEDAECAVYFFGAEQGRPTSITGRIISLRPMGNPRPNRRKWKSGVDCEDGRWHIADSKLLVAVGFSQNEVAEKAKFINLCTCCRAHPAPPIISFSMG